jgi:hypothetical protein
MLEDQVVPSLNACWTRGEFAERQETQRHCFLRKPLSYWNVIGFLFEICQSCLFFEFDYVCVFN